MQQQYQGTLDMQPQLYLLISYLMTIISCLENLCSYPKFLHVNSVP
jgi:hypothetical protein